MDLKPATVEEAQQAICRAERVHPYGSRTKTALSYVPEEVAALDMSGIRGVTDYDPAEFTITAYAGTRLAEINGLLAANGQHLPFDPPFARRGATLGGTVAAGLSGPGRYLYGGVRDFILGVRYIDGEGRMVRGGGKVVKNAAGYDLPKVMVGSLGKFGALVEVTFKVLPRTETLATLRKAYLSLDEVLVALFRLSSSLLEILSIDFAQEDAGYILWARLGGSRPTMPARLNRLRAILEGGDLLEGAEEEALWEAAREMDWAPADWSLVKVPVTPRRIHALERALEQVPSRRWYSGGGQLAWVALPASPYTLEAALNSLGLSGLAVIDQAPGQSPSPRPVLSARLGLRVGSVFERRVKQALDPAGRFAEA